MSSRARISTSRVVVIALVVLACLASDALASRKRVVVLPFAGDKAEKFHDSVVKLIRKTHTVFSSAKWATTAEALSADTLSEKDIRKVAKKLKIDGVVEGRVEKRRNEYILRFHLYAGTTGELVKPVNTKAENIKLDGDAELDIKDELVPAIGELETNRTTNDDEEDEEEVAPPEVEKPVVKDKKGFKGKKGATTADDDELAKEETKPLKDDKKKRKATVVADDEDETQPVKDDKKKATLSKKHGDTEEEDPLPEERKRKSKKVAKKADRGEGEGEGEEGVTEQVAVEKKTGAAARTPAERAIDAVVGLSITTRRLAWATDADLVQKPPAYKGLPAPGGMFDVTFYPMAFSHTNEGVTKDIGVTVMYDQALLISSKDQNGNTLKTAYSRYAIGGVYRYEMGANLIGGTLTFGRQSFQIQNSEAIGIPNVNYTQVAPGGFLRHPINDKITLNVDLGVILVLKTGQMQKPENYGGATVFGFEGELGGDYALSGSLFVRAGLKVESIGLSFKGNGMRTNADADPEQDVQGARDTYIGLLGTLGYIY